MARSKAFEALLEEAGKTAQKGGETLKQVVPFDQTDRQADSRTDKQTDSRADRQTVGQTNRQTVGQTVRHSDRQTDEQTVGHSDRQADSHDFENEFHWMTQKQAEILSLLVNKKSRITSLNRISELTGIPYGTVRGSINKLVKEKCISKPSRYRRGNAQGITYNLNEELCAQFKCHKLYRQTVGHSDRHSDSRTVSQTLSQTDQKPISYSSSSVFKETTTAVCRLDDIDTLLQENPELGYWRQKNLSVKQIRTWMKTAGCSPETMIQYLCYCRFDMVDRNQEKKKSINNVFNWFFRIIEKTGSYPRPKGYKSHIEKQIEEEQRIVEEREQQIQKLEELQRKKWQQQQDLDFWEMMKDPDGDIYRQCFAKLNKYQQGRAQKGGRGFEMAMRNAFDEIMGYDDSA